MIGKKHFLALLLIFLIVLGCKENNPKPLDYSPKESQESQTVAQLPTIVKISSEVEAEIAKWDSYKDFEKSFVTLTRKNKKEELKLLVDELIEKEKNINKDSIPEPLNDARIKSRLKVLETYLLETKAKLSEAQVAENTITNQKAKLLLAFNALRNQFTEVLTNNISETLLDDE